MPNNIIERLFELFVVVTSSVWIGTLEKSPKDVHDFLQGLSVCLQGLLNLFLIVAQLAVECLTISDQAPHGLNENRHGYVMVFSQGLLIRLLESCGQRHGGIAQGFQEELESTIQPQEALGGIVFLVKAFLSTKALDGL